MRVNSDHYRGGGVGGIEPSRSPLLSCCEEQTKKPHESSIWARDRGKDGKTGGEVGAAWTGTEGERERERVRDYRGHLADERHRGSFAPIPFLSRQPSTVYLPRRGDGGPARSACAAPCQTLRGCLCFLGFFSLTGDGGQREVVVGCPGGK